MYIEVRCLYDMLLVVENGKIVSEEYEPETPLSRNAQDWFVEYTMIRNLDIKEKFLKCVEEERFKLKKVKQYNLYYILELNPNKS